jgi:hypothetical protein
LPGGAYVSMGSTNLWGQVDPCGAKIVGDGVVNVFDIAALIAYTFADSGYATLDPNPENVPTVQGRDGLESQCEAKVSLVDYYTDYAGDTCVHSAAAGRRLSSVAEILTSWNEPLIPVRPAMTIRPWQPLVSQKLVLAPGSLPVVQYSIIPEFDFEDGRWYTLRIDTVPIRILAAFGGLTQEATKLSEVDFDGSPPEDRGQQLVRFTRHCEFFGCDGTCAAIETVHPSRTAIVNGTLSLAQRPIERACPFELHLWVPYDSASDRCVNIKYAAIADGLHGRLVGPSVCTRQIAPPSPPASPPPSPPVSPPSAPPLIPGTEIAVLVLASQDVQVTESSVSLWKEDATETEIVVGLRDVQLSVTSDAMRALNAIVAAQLSDDGVPSCEAKNLISFKIKSFQKTSNSSLTSGTQVEESSPDCYSETRRRRLQAVNAGSCASDAISFVEFAIEFTLVQEYEFLIDDLLRAYENAVGARMDDAPTDRICGAMKISRNEILRPKIPTSENASALPIALISSISGLCCCCFCVLFAARRRRTAPAPRPQPARPQPAQPARPQPPQPARPQPPQPARPQPARPQPTRPTASSSAARTR